MLPLVVVQVLSRNKVASSGFVKDWLLVHIWIVHKELHTLRFLFFRAAHD